MSAKLSELIRGSVEALSSHPRGLPDAVAKGHGALPLLADIGGLWMLRPDGTILELVWDEEGPPSVASEGAGLVGLVAGSERYPWLSELLPQRPADAANCPSCDGQGQITIAPPGKGVVFCGSCSALGWRRSGQEAQ